MDPELGEAIIRWVFWFVLIVQVLMIGVLIADRLLRKRVMNGFRTANLEVWLREQVDRLDHIARLEEEIAAIHKNNRVDWKKEGF